MVSNNIESTNEARIIELIKARFCKYVQPEVKPDSVEVLKAGWQRRQGWQYQMFEIKVNGLPVDYYPYFLLEYKQALRGDIEIKVASSRFDSQPKKR